MTDIWALGITIYYLMTGQYPCEDARSPLQLRDFIVDRPINFGLVKHEGAKDLLMKMLEKDPANRESTKAKVREADRIRSRVLAKIEFKR